MANSTQLYDEFGGKLYPYSLTTLVLDEKGKMLETRLQAMERLLEWFEMDNEEGMIKVKYGLYSVGAITAGGKMSSSEGGTEIPETSVSSTLNGLTDVKLSGLADGHVLAYDDISGMWVNKTIAIGDKVTQSAIQDALGYLPMNPADFSKANIKSKLGISDWALSTSKPSYNKSDVGLGDVDNIAANKYFTALSSSTTNAVSITIGGVTKSITAATLKTSLGLAGLAYQASVPAALGYTPFNEVHFTKTNIKSVLEISDWALSTSKPSYNKSDVGLGNVDNLAAEKYFTDLSSNATDAISATIGGVNKKITAGTLKSSLGLGSLAYKSSLVASDIPSLPWSKITSGTPTTLNGYGITDAYTITQINSKFDNTMLYSDRIDLASAYHHIGYGYTTSGWKTAGPAAVFGTSLYNLRMQLAISNIDIPCIYVSQMYNGEAKGWAELVTYEGAKNRVFYASQYWIGDTVALHRSGEDTFLNYGNRATGNLYLYGTGIRFSTDAGASNPLKILGDGTVFIHDVALTKGASGSLKAAAYEALQYFADGKLMLHRNTGAMNLYLNYGGSTEPLYVYGSMYGFHIGESRERAFTIDANKDASFAANLTVSGLLNSTNFMAGGYLVSDPSSSFQSSIFGATDSSYRIRTMRSSTAIDRFTAAYSPMLTIKTSDTHAFISIGYSIAGKSKCYIGAGINDALNWRGILFHDNMDLIPKDNNAFTLGDSSYQWKNVFSVLGTFSSNIKIGDATLSWDSSIGMLKIDKGIYSTGAITAGGKGQNEISTNLGPVKIDLEYILGTPTLKPLQARAAGLTEDVINNLLAGKYTKVTSSNALEVWDYTGYSSGGVVSLYFTQGDGFIVQFGLMIRRTSINDDWVINYSEI